MHDLKASVDQKYTNIRPGMALIPFMLLAVLNFKLYRKIKVNTRASQKNTFVSSDRSSYWDTLVKHGFDASY